jgi:hypothetical protein
MNRLGGYCMNRPTMKNFYDSLPLPSILASFSLPENVAANLNRLNLSPLAEIQEYPQEYWTNKAEE